MFTAASTLHIVFSLSAAHDLGKALAELGQPDEVLAFSDDLSFGPINPPDSDLRAQWVESELGWTGWEEVGEQDQAFWAGARSNQCRRIAWMSRRSTHEYANFLEFVWRLGDAPCDVVDLTDVLVTGREENGQGSAPRLAGALALLPAYQIVEANLLERAQPLTKPLLERYRIAWRTLRAENAPLRVLRDDLELVSAPISFFDEQLVSYVKQSWLKAARIVGETLAAFMNEARFQTGDLVLASRLRALAAAGRLEAKGDLSQLMYSEVRLPSPR